MTLTDQVAAMPAEQRAGAIAILDHLTRPLTVREIEGALQKRGVSRSRAVIIAASVKHLHVVAMVGGEA